jgi:acetyl-CoA carboxylase, biotin carboxylase subunit
MTLERVFVANRGEIAVRILRTCRELGIETVLGVSSADREGLAAELADRSVCIGAPRPSDSYLRHDTIVEAALGTGCDAIHPGYGFLSENPALAAGAAEHGIRFVGPPAEVIELAGDKLRARAVAEQAGLQVVPGRAVATLAEAEAFAAESGYPVLLKAAGGGGGRGIRLAEDAHTLATGFGLAVAEADAAFGDGRLYVEHFVAAARHVEVQVIADEHGAVLHLGERDCSTQRRYQKVIEEAPAPGLGGDVRAALAEAALAFARALAYCGLGTVEFVLDAATGEFFFLEMNCRIQVEHPVTEAVTGRDLVADQLAIAGGRPLALRQDGVRIDGHAVECRLTAEDVGRGFRPSPGVLARFEAPAIPGLRVDTHCRTGATISPWYDSLVAKLIAHGSDRDEALAILVCGLEELVVQGVATNRELLLVLLRAERFAAADVTTSWLEESLA